MRNPFVFLLDLFSFIVIGAIRIIFEIIKGLIGLLQFEIVVIIAFIIILAHSTKEKTSNENLALEKKSDSTKVELRPAQ